MSGIIFKDLVDKYGEAVAYAHLREIERAAKINPDAPYLNEQARLEKACAKMDAQTERSRVA